MTELMLYFTWTGWRQSWRRLVATLLQWLGGFVLVRDVTEFLFPGSTAIVAGGCTSAAILGAVVLGVAWCRPTTRIERWLQGEEIKIEIRIGDVFDTDGALVVSTNSTFDTDISKGLISKKSVQGKFTTRYYGEGQEHILLDCELEAALKGVESEPINDGREGKKRKYSIGTVAKLRPRGRGTAKERTVYMVAITDMNEHGIASGSYEYVLVSLAKLWHYIGDRGDLEPITIPILGTGRARIPSKKREEFIQAIIDSFIAACSEKKFCERLTIVVYRDDYSTYDIDLRELESYLNHRCRYAELGKGGANGGGKEIEG